MSVEYLQLAQSAVTTAGTTVPIFTNPSSGTTTCVRQIWLHVGNYGCTGFSETSCLLFVVPDSAGSLGRARPTEQFFARSMATGETYLLDCGVPGIILTDVNDTIQMWHLNSTNGTGAGTTINYIVSGTSETA